MPFFGGTFRIFVMILAFMLTGHYTWAQKLDHRLGEILVVFEESADVDNFRERIAYFEGSRNHARVNKLITSPIKIYKVYFDHNRTHEYRFLESVRQMNGISMAQFNHLIEYRIIPDDPQFPNQWQYINDGSSGGVEGADLDMELAWDITTGGLTVNGDTIVACVIDGGLDPTHEDFGDNLWKNYAEIPDNGIDDDNNGYIDDFDGWNVRDNNDDVLIINWHGTNVAGIIGAQGNNGIGVSGVNWDVKLMIIRGSVDEAQQLTAYQYPYKMRKLYNETNGAEGAFVVTTNSSWGTDFLHYDEARIWCSFYDSLGVVGILNCGATINGNYNIDIVGDMPTSCPSEYLLSVTNMARNDEKVTSAGYGLETIDLGAFGEGTWTTSHNNSYGAFGGTSGATPHVAGAVALAYAVDCQLLADLAMENPAEAAILVRNMILSGVDENESLQGITTTGGRLNVNNTLLALQNYCSECPYPLSADISGITTEQATITWSVTVDSTDFDMVYKEKQAMDWDTLFNIQSPLTLNNLNECSAYEFKLRTRCTGINSDFGFPIKFETDGCCILPQSHRVNILDSVWQIELEDIVATDTYTLEYKIYGTSNWQKITLDTNVFNLASLGECQNYIYRFRSVCSEEQTDFSENFLLSVGCDACSDNSLCEITGGTSFEHIDSLVVADFVNQSGKDLNGYGDYSSAKALILTAGESYDFKLFPAFSQNAYDEFIEVYLDLDLNGQLDEGEMILSGMYNGGEAFEAMLEIPDTVTTGYSKLRVIMSFFEITDPCQSLTYGEIEDYCVELTPKLPDCLSDEIFLDTLEVSSEFIHFHWNDHPLSNNYTFRYRLSGDSTWIISQIQDTSLMLAGLEDCSTYEFQLRRDCDEGEGEYTEILLLKTDCVNSTINVNREEGPLDIFPNPFDKHFRIKMHDISMKVSNIKIIGSDGVILFDQAYNSNEVYIGPNIIKQFEGGVYFVEILTEKKNRYLRKLAYLP